MSNDLLLDLTDPPAQASVLRTAIPRPVPHPAVWAVAVAFDRDAALERLLRRGVGQVEQQIVRQSCSCAE